MTAVRSRSITPPAHADANSAASGACGRGFPVLRYSIWQLAAGWGADVEIGQ
jgi:hypothetical protein